MALKYSCALLLAFVASAIAAPGVQFGACIISCDSDSNSCPSGQECRSNGCGKECFDVSDNKLDKRGSCITYCSPHGNQCSEMYECRSNGCGHQCYRGPDFKQPSHCKMFKCVATNCPYGYAKEENGCEECRCRTMVDVFGK